MGPPTPKAFVALARTLDAESRPERASSERAAPSLPQGRTRHASTRVSGEVETRGRLLGSRLNRLPAGLPEVRTVDPSTVSGPAPGNVQCVSVKACDPNRRVVRTATGSGSAIGPSPPSSSIARGRRRRVRPPRRRAQLPRRRTPAGRPARSGPVAEPHPRPGRKRGRAPGRVVLRGVARGASWAEGRTAGEGLIRRGRRTRARRRRS